MSQRSLSFYTSAEQNQEKPSLDGKATPWKLLGASLYFGLGGKSCSGTCEGHQQEGQRDDLLIFLIPYLPNRAVTSLEVVWTGVKMRNWTIHANPAYRKCTNKHR